MISIALYQPDIPQNTGTILRMAACLGTPVHIIEPTGFLWSLKSFRRAGMDYIDQVEITRHVSYQAFKENMQNRRMVLATTKASTNYVQFGFEADDVILFGRESAGVPDDVHCDCGHRVKVPIRPETRSLNLAVSAAMIVGEALRQTGLEGLDG